MRIADHQVIHRPYSEGLKVAFLLNLCKSFFGKGGGEVRGEGEGIFNL